jgi:Fe-S-cluster containining protein
MQRIARPLWRSFPRVGVDAAVRHALDGGIAVVEDRRWHLLGDAGARGEALPVLVDWAIRAVEAERWWEVTEGPARGCVKALVPTAWRPRVREWLERDRAWEGATAPATFDCTRCAACCYDNAVELDDRDLARLRRTGDPSLLRLRKVRGKTMLPLVGRDRRCAHLQASLACGIYAQRPFMCREFPAGSEQCLTSREEIYDSPFPAGR